jgi:hypothetical protein
MPRLPRSYLHPPAGSYAPGRMAWAPATRPIRRTPIQAYRPVQGIPLQPSTAQAIIGGGIIPSGGAGNFAQSVGNNANFFNCEIWADPNCAGGQSSVTVSFSGLQSGGAVSRLAIFVMEWSAINTSSPVDKTNSGAIVSGSTFSSGATGVLTQADEVVIGAVVGEAGSTETITGPSSPWSNFAQLSPVVNLGFMTGYQVVSATTSQTYSGTVTPNNSSTVACIASYKATGTPALVQSPPGVASNNAYTSTTTSVTVSLASPTTAGNCLIVTVTSSNNTTGTPVVSGITTSAAASASSGLATCQLGPAGLGNLWFPTQVTLSTTTGITTGLDTSVANLYLGPAGVATTLLGTVFGGNGIVAAALPNIQPGLYLIAQWVNGINGDQATMNVQGVMNAYA